MAKAYERARLGALHQYDMLDTPSELGFDRITRFAAKLFDAPIALVDAEGKWFQSRFGLDADGPNINTPILAFTGDAANEASRFGADAGFDGLILRPIDPYLLIAEVARVRSSSELAVAA